MHHTSEVAIVVSTIVAWCRHAHKRHHNNEALQGCRSYERVYHVHF